MTLDFLNLSELSALWDDPSEPEAEPQPEAVVEPTIAVVEPAPEPQAEAVVEPTIAVVEPTPEPQPEAVVEPTIAVVELEESLEVVEVRAPRQAMRQTVAQARSSSAAPGPTVEVDLPAGLMAAIDAMSPDDDEQIELEDSDGQGFGSLSQLQTASSRYDEIAWSQDLVVWREFFIGRGRTKFKLDWGDMGFSPEAIVALKKANATKSAVTLLESVENASNELKGLRASFQKGMLLIDGNWCSTARLFGAKCIELSDVLDREVELRRDINASYGAVRRSSLVTIAEIMSTTTDMSQIEIATALEKYASIFPTREEVNRSFCVRIGQPQIKPALKRRLEGQADTAELIARIAAADRTAEEQAAIARLNRETERIIMQKKAEAIQQFDRKVLQAIADALKMLKRPNVKPGNLTKSMQSAINAALSDLRLMTATPWAESMRDAVAEVDRIGQLAQDEDVSADQLRDEIDGLITSFTEEFHFTPATRGHRGGVPDIEFDDD